MRVVAFHRGASGTNDSDGGNQSVLQPLLDFCERNEHKLVAAFGPEEGWLDDGRLTEQYNAVREFFSNERPALILIPDTTHLANDLPTLTQRLIEIDSWKCEVRCLNADYPDPLQNGETFLDTVGSSTTSKTGVRDALAVKAARGVVLGRIPYGYAKSASGKYIPHHEEARVVKRIFALYTGTPVDSEEPTFNQPIGLRRICSTLNADNIKTRRGIPWSPVAVMNLLNNRVYLGTYSRCGMKIVGNHPAIIPNGTFQRVKEISRQRAPQRGREALAKPYLLAGRIYCALCGSRMIGVSRRRAWTNSDDSTNERVYRYYECVLRSSAEGHSSWRADKILAKVLRKIENLDLEKMNLDRAVAAYVKGGDKASNAEIELAKREFVSRFRDVSSGRGSIADLDEPLSEFRKVMSSYNTDKVQPQFIPSANELRESAASPDLTEARRAIRALVRRIDVEGRKVQVKFNTGKVRA